MSKIENIILDFYTFDLIQYANGGEPTTLVQTEWKERNNKSLLPREEMKQYIVDFINKNVRKTRKEKMYKRIVYGL